MQNRYFEGNQWTFLLKVEFIYSILVLFNTISYGKQYLKCNFKYWPRLLVFYCTLFACIRKTEHEYANNFMADNDVRVKI